jgi:hypothetical protein
MPTLPDRDVIERLRDKKRALIVLKKPSHEGREAIVALARQRGLLPEREFRFTSSAPHTQVPVNAPVTLRIQQDVTITLNGVPLDPDGRVVLKQELAFDVDSVRPKPRYFVNQTDHLVWLKGERAVNEAREVVRCLDIPAAVSPAWRLPVASKEPQRVGVNPWACDVRVVRERPEIMQRLKRIGDYDPCPQYGSDWHELRVHEPPEDLYEFASRFAAEFDCDVELAFRSLPMITPLATAPPTDALYPQQRPSLQPIRTEEMWASMPSAAAALAPPAMTPTVVFLLDVGVHTGADAPIDPISTSAVGALGPVTPGGSTAPIPGVADPSHGTKLAGIMAAGWSGPAGGSGIAGIAGFCPATVSVASVSCLSLTDIAKSLDYAVACLSPGGSAAGRKGVVVIGHDILHICKDALDCACSIEKLLFDLALLNAEAHDILVIVPAGNYLGPPTFLDIPNVLPRTSSTMIIGASGDPATGGAFGRWNDLAGASRIDNGGGTGGPALIAPGANVYTVWNATGAGTYGSSNGTSCAAAHVAGVAALMRATRPAMTAAQVKQRLLDSARVLTPAPSNPPTHVGRGLLDAANAMAAAAAFPKAWP